VYTYLRMCGLSLLRTVFTLVFLVLTTVLACFAQNTCPLTGTVTLNFDSVSVPVGSFVDATSYLNSFGVTFTAITPNIFPAIFNGTVSADIPSSPPNFFGDASVVPGVGIQAQSYQLNFCAPLTSISFTRIAIQSNSGDAPWTASALNGLGQVVATVSEGFLLGPAAARYTLSGTGITALRIDARNDLTQTTNGSPPLDDLTLVGSGCQVNLCAQTTTTSTVGCVSVTKGGTLSLNGQLTSIFAQFTPPSGLSLTDAATACGFTEFDWVQVIDQFPSPSGLYTALPPNNFGSGMPISIPPQPTIHDPPFGGWNYPQSQQPPFLGAYPFYYNPVSIPFGCASYNSNGTCNYIMQGLNTLNFGDMPMNYCLPGGKYANNPAVCVFAPGSPLVPPFIGIGFTTQLVGICSAPSPACNISAPDTQWTWAPLYQWTWFSNFNGSSGGIFGVEPGNLYPADPGSGTGGVTITSISGVPSMPVGPGLCVPFPVTLGTPAGPNGVYITLTTSDPTSVTLEPGIVSPAITLFIPPGATTPNQRMPQACGVNFGSATVTVSGAALSTSNVVLMQVTAMLAFAQTSVTMTTTTQERLTLYLSAPAPAGGVTVNLSSDNPSVATVPTTVTIPPNATSVVVPITGVAAGSTTVHASALPNVPDTTAIVTVI
jgi:hypothetical protein